MKTRAPYRFVDAAGVVHEEEFVAGNAAWTTQCRRGVMFGEQWDDDYRIVVTCIRCLGRR